MGLDESIPAVEEEAPPAPDLSVDEGEPIKFVPPEQLDTVRSPEPLVPEPLSLDPEDDSAAVVVSDADDLPRSRHSARDQVESYVTDKPVADEVESESVTLLGGTPEAVEPLATEPEFVEPEPEPELLEPEPELVEPTPVPAQLPPVEIPRSREADDIDARAAALLQRIEAKRAELNRDMVAMGDPVAEPELVVAEQNPEDFESPTTARPKSASESEADEVAELDSVSEDVSEVEQAWEPQLAEAEPVSEPGFSEVEPESEQEVVAEAVSESVAESLPLVPESELDAVAESDSVAEVEQAWDPQPGEAERFPPAESELDVSVEQEQEAVGDAVSLAESVSIESEREPELDEVAGSESVSEPEPEPEAVPEAMPIAHAGPERSAPEVRQADGPTAPGSLAATPEPDGLQESSAPMRGEGRPRPAGRRLATPPWQIPNAVQQAPIVEPPPSPAYYVPPQQPAAQAPPPGWVPAPEQVQQWPPQQQAPLPPAAHAPPMGLDPYAGQQQSAAPQVPGGEMYWGHGQAPAGPPPQQINQVPPPGWGPAPVPQQPPLPVHPVHHEAPPGHVPPPQFSAPPANYQAPQAYRMPPSIDEAAIINRGLHAPRSGWRRAVHRASAGRVNPGDSRKDRDHEDLLARIRQPILGDYRIAVLSIKGGVGKTTTTLGLGSAFATVRTDRIIAVDANPDRGTLAERVRSQSTHSTVRDLLNDDHINSYADVRNHTRMATSRLEVLASEQDPAVSEAFGEVDYRHTIEILQRYYNIILTDCGTGIMHSAMTGVLDLAHTIVLVSSPAMDAARSASATLDWLMQHGHSGLVREAHVVLSASRPGSAGIKLDKVYEHFEARCRSIHLVPFDPHLAEGADVDFNLLGPATNEAYLGLAGAIAANFPRLRMREQQM
ncbi:AAA family ATPase [Mycobacteroides saopaulense]